MKLAFVWTKPKAISAGGQPFQSPGHCVLVIGVVLLQQVEARLNRSRGLTWLSVPGWLRRLAGRLAEGQSSLLHRFPHQAEEQGNTVGISTSPSETFLLTGQQTDHQLES